MPTTSEADLALKLKHEKRLLGSARSLAAALAQRMRAALAGGSAPALQGPGEEVMGPMLREHYDKVARDFDHDLTDAMPDDLKPKAEELAQILDTLDRAFEVRATSVAAMVMENAQASAVKAVQRATSLVEQSDDLNPSDIPTLASNMFLTVQRARAASLACTETQWAAERAKGVEVQVLVGQEDGELKFDTQAFKTWRSQGDSRVRTAARGKFDHLAPDGQKVPTDQAFQVSGELLRWPGDPGLGASGGNLIGCRCSAIFDVESVVDLRRLLHRALGPEDAIPLVPEESNPFPVTESEVVEDIIFADVGN